MPPFLCFHCKQPILVTNWDLVPGVPDTYFCGACGAGNMLSRPTLLLTAVPSLVLMLLAGLTQQVGLSDGALVLAMTVAYVVGLPLGALLARRYGRLVTPHRLLLGWTPPAPAISDPERELMRQVGVEHNGQYFIVGDMHFDQLRDALAYARNRSSSVA